MEVSVSVEKAEDGPSHNFQGLAELRLVGVQKPVIEEEEEATKQNDVIEM